MICESLAAAAADLAKSCPEGLCVVQAFQQMDTVQQEVLRQQLSKFVEWNFTKFLVSR